MARKNLAVRNWYDTVIFAEGLFACHSFISLTDFHFGGWEMKIKLQKTFFTL